MTLSLPQWLAAAADEEAPNLKPLPAHGAAEHDEHTRERYAWLLAALLAQQESVSETQSRLFYLLLAALKLGDCRAALFEAAREFDKSDLVEAARLVREAGIGAALVLDAMVLLRLDQPLTEEQARMLADLAALLKLEEKTLTAATAATAITLGLPDAPFPPKPGDLPLNARAVWMGDGGTFILDAAALAAGIDGGRWRVMETIEVNFGWRIENAEVIFEPGASISTIPVCDEGILVLENGTLVQKANDVEIIHCKFTNPIFKFNGRVKAEHCIFAGEYPQEEAVSAITLAGVYPVDEAKETISLDGSSIFSHCHFDTRNARALSIGEKAGCRVEYCEFSDCGSSKLDGGAISVSINISYSDVYGLLTGCSRKVASVFGGFLTAKNSRFLSCNAKGAGAVYGGFVEPKNTEFLNQNLDNTSFVDCKFIDCGQINEDGSRESDLAVSIYCGQKNNILRSCFERCSVYFERREGYSSSDIHVRDCQFIQGEIKGYYINNSGCVFSQ